MRPSGELLTNYVALLWVAVGQPYLTPSQYASALVSHIEGGTQAEDVRQQDVEGDIRTEKR